MRRIEIFRRTCTRVCGWLRLDPAILWMFPGIGKLAATRLEVNVFPVPVQPTNTSTERLKVIRG